MTRNGSAYYLLYDQIGTLRAVADSSGTIVKQIDYDSFGFVLNDTNPSFAIPLGFAGGLHDRDTGLVRFGYRDYDPSIGRWTAKDPIDFAGGDANLYGYAQNDPVNWIDAKGNTAQEIEMAVKAALTFIVFIVDIRDPSAIKKMGDIGDMISVVSGVSGIFVAEQAAVTAPIFSVLLAGAGGWELGSSITRLYERYGITGQSLGEDWYDLLHKKEKKIKQCPY